MLTNLLLGLILIFMAFRIGKSVMMNFGDDLEPIFIVAGLATMLFIDPLLRWYVLGMIQPGFKLLKSFVAELIPFLLIFISSFFITKEWFDDNNKTAIILFGSVLVFIYLHFAFYIFLSWNTLKRAKKNYLKEKSTKSQKAIFDWLQFLIIGFVIIWFSYVLNVLDNEVPYIIDPITYSLAIYFLSYKAFRLKTTEIDGESFKENDNTELFNKISKLIVDEKLYQESDLSLSKLSKLIGQSTQKTSSVINQYAKRNFNDFINYYRIQDAKKILSNPESKKYTISSIAFDTGFSSLSSFNSAFKKFEKTTPSSYKKVFFNEEE
ncbi:helix-turn-helix domain-containing protein [Tenacibaculum retecalamus]|uniref:helix-turn-helix domain-containing protein n=1 Tax=Tenacibaculum retecalamus TaxID=3018315 RepID=UPI0023D9691C|nr:helix-turn-helix domain-containing protein [Tenacibaculum retecalamus]WBX71056.1 helix-turn-helix domain-containing protein [Tenacibaculum retecalamus]